jgi:outer membrane immunogenic protein
MMSPFTRSLAAALLAAAGIAASANGSFAQSNDEALRRLEAKLDALARENAALRDRVRRLEAARTPPAAAPAAAVVTQPRSTGTGAAPAIDAVRAKPASWTGFYVGGNAGYGWGDPTTSTSNNLPVTASNSSVLVPLNPAQYTTRNDGWIAGVQFGYNYQIPRGVLGFESDFNWTNIRGATEKIAICSGYSGGLPNCTHVQSQKLDWLATVRGRAGFVVAQETMIYGTAGLAIGHANVTHSLGTRGLAGEYAATATTSVTKTGWVVGAGIEAMIARHWMARLEYLHYDLGTVSSTAPIFNVVGPTATGTSAQADFRITGELARAGLSYKFD